MLHKQFFTAFVGSYNTCCDVIAIVNNDKTEVNAFENSNVF